MGKLAGNQLEEEFDSVLTLQQPYSKITAYHLLGRLAANLLEEESDSVLTPPQPEKDASLIQLEGGICQERKQ